MTLVYCPVAAVKTTFSCWQCCLVLVEGQSHLDELQGFYHLELIESFLLLSYCIDLLLAILWHFFL